MIFPVRKRDAIEARFTRISFLFLETRMNRDVMILEEILRASRSPPGFSYITLYKGLVYKQDIAARLYSIYRKVNMVNPP